MPLVGYQIECYEKLYDSLVNMDKQLIFFTGQKGCGKSTIIEELANIFKETWKVYLLAGIGETSPPYYTWYVAQKSVKQVKNRITDISFGVSFQPVGLPVGIEMSIGLTSGETMFNGNEQAIIKDIKRTAIEDNILFLADDYNAWDQASKELLEKIAICKTDIFGKEKMIVDYFNKLCTNDIEFQRSIESSTKNTSAVIKRFSEWGKCLIEALHIKIEIPEKTDNGIILK